MDALEFFNTVLPEQGRRCVGMLDNKMFRNLFGGSNEWANTISSGVDARGVNSYIALSGFGPEKSRTQENVVAVRCSWLDIDTQESKPKETYATRKDAIKALVAFCNETSMPKPLVVSSGYGLHVYWPYTRDVTRQQWKQIATLLKAACEKYGLAVDRSRTTDEASVLRPVGTHNHKNEPKLVKMVQRGETVDPDDLLVILANYLGDELDMFSQPAPSRMADLNSDLKGGITYQESSAETIAEHCGVVAHVRDTKGDTDQPTWYSVLGVVAFTTEGEDKCHEWSKGYDGYSANETANKIAQAKQYAPTTCEKLSQCQPDICKACPHFGKIKSPISLGTVRGEPQTLELPPEIATYVSTSVMEYPKGYGYSTIDGEKDKCLWYTKRVPEGEEGAMVDRRFFLCDVNLYPIARIEDVNKHHSMCLRMTTKKGVVTEFNVETGLIGKGDKSIMGELAKHELAVPASNRAQMEQYLSAWIGQLRDNYVNVPSVLQYGWYQGGFITGNNYITTEETKRAMVSGSAEVTVPFFEPQGTLEAWKAAVDKLYNHKTQEGLQFCMLLSFAAPLWHLYNKKGGCVAYAHSDDTGKGKSTAQMAGLAAWGNPHELLLMEKQFTVNSLYNHIGTMQHLPVMMEEMTNCTPEFASELVYAVSMGKDKLRLTPEGKARTGLSWATIVVANGNVMLTEKVSQHRQNAQGELARIFEFTLTANPIFSVTEANAITPAFDTNFGHAGRLYAKYLVDNREKVTRMLLAMRNNFDIRCNVTQKERYWSMLHSAVLTSLAICKKLELVQFDFEGVYQWIEQEMLNSRGGMVQSVVPPLEQFANMLADIYRGVLITTGEGNLAQGLHAEVVGHPQGPIIGRSIIEDRTSAAKLFVSVGAAKEWCSKHGVSFKGINDALIAEGWALPLHKRISLGKGTKQYSALGGPVKVVELNPNAMANGSSVAAKIIGVIQGGVDTVAAQA